MFKTYLEVSTHLDLDMPTTFKYLMFMRKRWPDSEEQKSKDGYALEWAYRFKTGSEYWCADVEGKKVLHHIYKILGIVQNINPEVFK